MLKKYSVTEVVTFLVTRDRDHYCRHIFICNGKCDGKSKILNYKILAFEEFHEAADLINLKTR
jgi:hypothetical protein